MKKIALLLFLTGCSLPPEALTEIAKRQVSFTIIGLYAVLPESGTVTGIGWVNYSRNMPPPNPPNPFPDK